MERKEQSAPRDSKKKKGAYHKSTKVQTEYQKERDAIACRGKKRKRRGRSVGVETEK